MAYMVLAANTSRAIGPKLVSRHYIIVEQRLCMRSSWLERLYGRRRMLQQTYITTDQECYRTKASIDYRDKTLRVILPTH